LQFSSENVEQAASLLILCCFSAPEQAGSLFYMSTPSLQDKSEFAQTSSDPAAVSVK